MRRVAAILIAGAASMALSGCAALIAVPAGAGAVMAKSQTDKRSRGKKKRAAEASRSTSSTGGTVVLTDLKALPAPDGSVAGPAPAPAPTPAAASAPLPPGSVPAGMQYLYGSGEAAALSYQAYLGLMDVVIAKSSDRAVGQAIHSVVLTPDATLDQPKFTACGDKPLAVVLDIDETALLNLGYEADDATRGGAFDAQRWDRWEKTGGQAVAPVPGMIELARVAKAAKVTLVYNSNRSAANAAATEAALDGAGLGPVHHLQNLWLMGDDGGGSGKDARRQAIAARYCVIAMAGDQLGDFSDLFNAPGLDPAQRRAAAQGRDIKILWGHGWFILPNPVYGTGLKGDADQIFPADKRWTDPGPTPAPATTGAKP